MQPVRGASTFVAVVPEEVGPVVLYLVPICSAFHSHGHGKYGVGLRVPSVFRVQANQASYQSIDTVLSPEHLGQSARALNRLGGKSTSRQDVALGLLPVCTPQVVDAFRWIR